MLIDMFSPAPIRVLAFCQWPWIHQEDRQDHMRLVHDQCLASRAQRLLPAQTLGSRHDSPGGPKSKDYAQQASC